MTANVHVQNMSRTEADTVNVGPGQRWDVIWRAPSGEMVDLLPYSAPRREQQRRTAG